MIGVLAIAIGLLAAPAPAPAAKKYESPIAVMPFKNLNDDAKTDWLQKGIAETMISDLKKSGTATTVVERDQVEKALQELVLTGKEATSSQAAGVGKLIGAKTIVLGAYQQSGKQVRINARFVSVETGVVLETAKVTGPIEGVFALQDQIVDKLLGTVKPAARPKRKTTTQAVEAYRLYAMSLSTATDAERVGLLKRSVAADPDFAYALEDLAALEKRMAAYAKTSYERLDQHDRLIRDRLFAADTSSTERTQLAMTLLQSLLMTRRYHACIEEARQIRALRIPSVSPGLDVSEQASYYEFLSLDLLNRKDEVLRIGERHLQEHPGGSTYRMVEMKMNAVVREKRDAAERKADFERLLVKHDADRKAVNPASARLSLVRAAIDMDECNASRALGEPQTVLETCGRVVRNWSSDPDEDVRNFVRLARWTVVLAHASAGDFVQARAGADALFAEEPSFANQVALRSQVDTWPVDAP